MALRPQTILWRHRTPRSTLTPTHHLPLPAAGSQTSRTWTRSVPCWVTERAGRGHSLRLRGCLKPEICSGCHGKLRGFLGQGPLSCTEVPAQGLSHQRSPDSSSVRCRAHLDLSPRAHSPLAPCPCLSLTPALDSPAPTCSPRRESRRPEPLSGIAGPSRAGGPGPQAPLSL